MRKISKRGIVGIEAAIILIAFVIVATAFAFMVVNMGLTSTQRGKEAIGQGLKEATSPLTLDGTMLLKSDQNYPNNISNIIIPLKTLGVKYVPMWENETVVSIKIGTRVALANIYAGINHTIDPTTMTFDAIINNLTSGHLNDWWTKKGVSNESDKTGAVLVIVNDNKDDSLDFYEKGYLVIQLGANHRAYPRENIVIEIRPEKSAPLTIEFTVPDAVPPNAYITVG
jgi:flagellin FlaB